MKKLFLLFIILIIISCSKKIDKNIIVYAKTSISSLNIMIGDVIEYQVNIISKEYIDYEFEDVSFDTRDNKVRIISVENKIINRGEYRERIIKYQIGFYDIGQFVIYPFEIKYDYNNEKKELYGEGINIFVYPFSDGDILPPIKNTLSIPISKYVLVFIVLFTITIIGIILLILFVVKYIDKRIKEKVKIKEDTEALNALKAIDVNAFYNENKYAEYYFELTFIFKRYLTKRLDYNIEDMTTSEINKLFTNSDFNNGEYIVKMFRESDYVKFAKQIPEFNIMKKDYDFCVDYIIENGNLEDQLKLEEKDKKKKSKIVSKNLN